MENAFTTPPLPALGLSLAHLTRAQSSARSLQVGHFLEFHLKSNCSSLPLSRCRRHRWVFCSLDGMRKHTTQHPKNTDNTRPGGRRVDRGAVAPGRCAAPRDSDIPWTTSLGQDQNSQFQAQLLNAYHFHTVVKLKNCKSNDYILQKIGYVDCGTKVKIIYYNTVRNCNS